MTSIPCPFTVPIDQLTISSGVTSAFATVDAGDAAPSLIRLRAAIRCDRYVWTYRVDVHAWIVESVFEFVLIITNVFCWMPMSADEVGASEGDVIEGLSQADGWWRVQHRGKSGLFPGNYVEVGTVVAGVQLA